MARRMALGPEAGLPVTRPRAGSILALMLALAGCGCAASKRDGASTRGDEGGAGNGGGGSDASGARSYPEPVTCPGSYAIVGVPEDMDNRCTLNDSPIKLVCASAKRRDHFDRFCLRYLPTGQRFWIVTRDDPELTQDWALCSTPDDASEILPPCFAKECTPDHLGRPGPPDSLCSEAETRRLWQCGGTGFYDENCCLRESCETDEDCPAGLVCRQGRFGWYYLQAWPQAYNGEGCDRGGASLDATRYVCMPSDLELCPAGTLTGMSCDDFLGSNACAECLRRSCCDAIEACTGDVKCSGLLSCIVEDDVCADEDYDCLNQQCNTCYTDAAVSTLKAADACVDEHCAAECNP